MGPTRLLFHGGPYKAAGVYVPKNSASRAHRAHERRPGEIVGGCLISGRVLSFLTLPLSPSPRPASALPFRILSSSPRSATRPTALSRLHAAAIAPSCSGAPRQRMLLSAVAPSRHATSSHPTSRRDRGKFSRKVRQNEHYSTASLSHLRTMLPESSSCPQPAQRPNHAT